MSKSIIAIAGNARSGKDTLGDNWVKCLANNGIRAKKYAFADELKRSVDDFLIRELGISAWTKDSKEKDIIRPFLVFWGTDVMRKKNDNCWVERLEASISKDADSVAIITDLRFTNELEWVKCHENSFTYMIRREDIPPANKYELEQNNLLASEVDDLATLANIEDPDILEAVSEILLGNLIPIETIEIWRQTYPLLKKSKKKRTNKV